MKISNIKAIAVLVISIFLGESSGCTTRSIHNPSDKLPSDSQVSLEIKIGSQDSTHLAMKALVDAYKSQVKNVQISFVPMTHSGVALKGVRDGLLDISSVDEDLKLEDNALEYYLVAKDPLLVATHPSVGGITNMTTANLQAIYSGTLQNWQELGGVNAKIVVLDLPENHSAKRLLRKSFLGKDLKNSRTAILLRGEEDVISAVQNIPYSIGFFSYAGITRRQLRLNPQSLNGVELNSDNVKTGKYHMVRPIRIVSKKRPTQAVRAFLQFVRDKQAASVLTEAGFLPYS